MQPSTNAPRATVFFTYPSRALALEHPLHVDESIFQRYAMGLHQLLVDGISGRRVPQIGGGFDEFQRIAGAQRTKHFHLQAWNAILGKMIGLSTPSDLRQCDYGA